MKNNKYPGFVLIEVLISFAILSILVATFLPILAWLISRTKASAYDAQASLVLQEAIEVSYNVMAGGWDGDWSKYPQGIYHPAVDMGVSPAIWTLLPGVETGIEAKFNRQIEIQPVCRNNGTGEKLNGNCPEDAGTRDNNSKIFLATVGWTENGRPKSISAELLVTNLGN